MSATWTDGEVEEAARSERPLVRTRAAERAGALLRERRAPAETARLAGVLAALASDRSWGVRAAVADAVQHLRHPQKFDEILGLLKDDEHRYVRRLAAESRRRRRQAIEATSAHLDEVEEVESRLLRFAAERSPELADEARRLALAYLRVVVSQTVHDARNARSSVNESLRRLQGVLIAHDVPPDEWTEHLEDARRRVSVTYSTLLDMQRFAAEETGAFQRVRLAELVADVVKNVRDRLLVRRSPRIVEVGTDVDDLLDVDVPRDLLVSALENVVQNSIEAGAGRVTITAAADHEANLLRLIVADDGSGIAERDRTAVFLPGQSTKKGDPGAENTGFGLTNARRIVERDCKGRVELASAEGEGTTVTFVLPIDRGREDAA